MTKNILCLKYQNSISIFLKILSTVCMTQSAKNYLANYRPPMHQTSILNDNSIIQCQKYRKRNIGKAKIDSIISLD